MNVQQTHTVVTQMKAALILKDLSTVVVNKVMGEMERIVKVNKQIFLLY